MSMLKLYNGVTYSILDNATPNSFGIQLNGMTVEDVLKNLTEENLSEIQFMTDSGAVTGVYKNKLLCGYVDHGDTLEASINDADLCRYGLTLDEDNRIVSAVPQRYAQDGAIIVDALPDGDITDYRYVDGEYIHDPLPATEETAEPTEAEKLEAQVLYTAMMTDTLLEV